MQLGTHVPHPAPPLEEPGAVRLWDEDSPLATWLTQRVRAAGYDGGHAMLPDTEGAAPLETP